MKALTLFLILSVFMNCTSFSQDNKFSLGLGTGIGIYGGSNNDKNSKDTTAIKAACGLVVFHGDYLFNQRISAGFQLERNGFLTDTNSSNHANSVNLGLSVKYIFYRSFKNLLIVGFQPGFSMFTFTRGINKESVTSTGANVQAGLGWEHFIGHKFGFYINSYYTFYNYSQIYNNKNELLKVNTPEEDFTLNLYGVNTRIGLLFRF